MGVGSIIVSNLSDEPCHVFVSKYSRPSASDDWFTIPPHSRESWERAGWELVAFKNANDTDLSGVYVRVNSTVSYEAIHNVGVH